MIEEFVLSKMGKLINIIATVAWIMITFIYGDQWWSWFWLAILLYFDFIIFKAKRSAK
jgi:hypothetical protein